MPTAPNNEVTVLAQTNFRGQRRRFGIKIDDRRRHVYLIGKTGMGKSTMLENMIIQDIQAGRGVTVVDPHGDLVEKVINFVPNERINDVIYFNPADLDFPIAFNVFEQVGREHQHLVASGLIGIFKKLWSDSWGPRLEYVLRNAILALLEYPDSTLLGVMRLLVDKGYRKKVMAKITDPVVRSFWIDEYSKYPDKFQSEAIAPIQNKVGQFLSSPVIRNIVGQVRSSFSMREVMDEGKILLLNLAKGRIGEDNSALLGAMLITKIQMAAMSRVNIAETDRRDFYLYVDEFQNFATESFANILSEARKYRLNLIIAHQYIEQLEEEVQAAVFGNVGTLVCFRVGAADAEALTPEFDPYFTEIDLVNLGKYDVYMKLMIDGIASQPFSATTLPPLGGEVDNKEKII
ncbi:MAG: type IV secretion system DNA-binding domain-containing protein, partial [Candidatus Komeilibacteria bacterium]|nr:type IV secretion system DNA-binding domain-containing protein [Candidatus Komeilibacteria bacterium]